MKLLPNKVCLGLLLPLPKSMAGEAGEQTARQRIYLTAMLSELLSHSLMTVAAVATVDVNFSEWEKLRAAGIETD